jgi:hypothetical protein
MKRLDPVSKEDIGKMLRNHPDREMLKENLRLKHFRTGTKSASDIEIYVKRLINHGFKPDLITIDYFECISPEKGGYSTDTEWTREGVTMRKLENMAKDLNCAIWIPTQSTKDGMNSPDGLTMNQAGGSAKKVQVAQLVLSIARAMNDIDRNRAVISVLKNRSGKSGKIFQDVKFDNGTCTISCDEVMEYDDALTWKEDAKKQEEKAMINLTKGLVEKRQNKNTNIHNEVADNDFNPPVEGNYVGRVMLTDPNKEFKI